MDERGDIGIGVAEFEIKEPKIFHNPPAFKKLIRDVHDSINDYQHECFLYVEKPNKPSASKRKFPEDWERYEKKRAKYDEELDAAVAFIKPEEATVPSRQKNKPLDKLFPQLGIDRERKRKQAVVDNFNQGMAKRLMDFRKAAFFGTIEEAIQIAEELMRVAEPMQKSREEPTNLNELIPLVKAYRESIPEPGLNESYAKLTNYLVSKNRQHVIPTTKLTRKDSQELFYLPQLNLVAKGQEHDIFLMDLGPCLSAGWGDLIPSSEELLAIPLNAAFPRPETKPATESNKPVAFPETLDAYLDQLQETKGEPNPEEIIKMPGRVSEEKIIELILKGANPFYPTRQQLQEAGFVFVNSIGGGEKYIIKAEVMIDGQLVDLGKISLLTQKQLDAALELDRQEMGDIPTTAQAVARDMLDYLHAPSYLFTKRFNEIKDALHSSNPTMGIAELERKAEEQTAEEFKEIKGREMTLKPGFMSRGMESMGNVPCSFLDCSHHLGLNRDLTFEDEGKGYVRLSTVVAHLANHGLSERGDGLPNSIDQRYMTVSQYYQLMMKPPEAALEGNQ